MNQARMCSMHFDLPSNRELTGKEAHKLIIAHLEDEIKEKQEALSTLLDKDIKQSFIENYSADVRVFTVEEY